MVAGYPHSVRRPIRAVSSACPSALSAHSRLPFGRYQAASPDPSADGEAPADGEAAADGEPPADGEAAEPGGAGGRASSAQARIPAWFRSWYTRGVLLLEFSQAKLDRVAAWPGWACSSSVT